MIPREISEGFVRLANEAMQHGVRIDRLDFESTDYSPVGAQPKAIVTGVKFDAKYFPHHGPKSLETK